MKDQRFYHWVAATLLNDENSSDNEMLQYFMEQGNMSLAEARFYMAQRNDAIKHDLNFELKRWAGAKRNPGQTAKATRRWGDWLFTDYGQSGKIENLKLGWVDYPIFYGRKYETPFWSSVAYDRPGQIPENIKEKIKEYYWSKEGTMKTKRNLGRRKYRRNPVWFGIPLWIWLVGGGLTVQQVVSWFRSKTGVLESGWKTMGGVSEGLPYLTAGAVTALTNKYFVPPEQEGMKMGTTLASLGLIGFGVYKMIEEKKA